MRNFVHDSSRSTVDGPSPDSTKSCAKADGSKSPSHRELRPAFEKRFLKPCLDADEAIQREVLADASIDANVDAIRVPPV